MIDIFSILLTHSLILLVGWRLLFRKDLDVDDPEPEAPMRPWLKVDKDKVEAAQDA